MLNRVDFSILMMRNREDVRGDIYSNIVLYRYCSYACANIIIVREVKIFRKKECTLEKNCYLCITYKTILPQIFCMILNRTNIDRRHPISKWGGGILLYINKL